MPLQTAQVDAFPLTASPAPVFEIRRNEKVDFVFENPSETDFTVTVQFGTNSTTFSNSTSANGTAVVNQTVVAKGRYNVTLVPMKDQTHIKIVVSSGGYGRFTVRPGSALIPLKF